MHQCISAETAGSVPLSMAACTSCHPIAGPCQGSCPDNRDHSGRSGGVPGARERGISLTNMGEKQPG